MQQPIAKPVLKHNHLLIRSSLLLVGLLLALLVVAPPASVATNRIMYDDSLSAEWENWSWNSTVAFDSTDPLHSGTNAIAVTSTAAFSGFSLRQLYPVVRFLLATSAIAGRCLRVSRPSAPPIQPGML
ncbi:MAG: hypothetical protein HC876_06080 [Chloroflexaceae bacterium]|nr:hypothetical protein [Chloroflexaceae bacterium]NJO05111.1 hypothetical protein [Chloroflexaceae bacterium]